MARQELPHPARTACRGLAARADGTSSARRDGDANLERGDDVLALKLTQLALLRHPGNEDLAQLRRRALDNLRARNQAMNPFKFIIYSEWAGAELAPVE